jgi:alkylhydroperoxidase family enzyme
MLDAMTWLPETTPGDTPLDAVFGLCPPTYERFRELYGGLWHAEGLDPVVVELCRLRVATLLHCEAELCLRYQAARDAGLGEAQIEELPRWPTSPVFTALQRACLGFAEQYVLDPHGVSDEQMAELGRHLDRRGIASLTLALAMTDALARFRLALGVTPVAEWPHPILGPDPRPASLP